MEGFYKIKVNKDFNILEKLNIVLRDDKVHYNGNTLLIQP